MLRRAAHLVLLQQQRLYRQPDVRRPPHRFEEVLCIRRRAIFDGSDDEVAEFCTTTTTTAFAGISGNISIYTDGGCSVLDGTHSIDLGPCTMTGSTSSQDFTCMEGSIAYNVYSTNDCTGEATTQVFEQGPCNPVDNGTSSWLVAFPGCTGGASSSDSSAAVHLNVGFMILSLLACR
ncbi:msrA [Symbiodinium necroappetens]|uniref:MsrA protein n=1 Tax=Symbiodinium necroappetens TaxID=1628268 RepID=A0A812LXP3_9DINO|nr:msrA [Symbiodinium necroappetens]